MKWVINRRSKHFFLAVIFSLGQFCYAQTDVVTLSRAKDFINAGLTYIILSNDSIRKDSAGKNWLAVDTVLQKNTLANPLYYAAMRKLLEGRFDSVTKKFSSKLDSVDVSRYTSLDEQKALQSLYDTAFVLLRQKYGNFFSPASRDSVYLVLMSKAEPPKDTSLSEKVDTVPKPVEKKSSAPPYTPWYARFQGFVFWLLACVLISVALFLYCLDQIRQLKIKLEESDKTITQLREEADPLSPKSGPVTTVYTEFRNLVTLKIKELYDIIDHLNLRIISLEKEHQEPPSLLEEASNANELLANGDIFYMGVPQEGYFAFSARSLKKDGLYKFTLMNHKTEATFEVINDGMPILEALKEPAKFFEPACIIENDPQAEVRVVITKSPGIAVFDGEKWAIQQKASILFI